jgi:hypothetical protein
MTLNYQSNGSLRPGFHQLTFKEIVTEFGFNKWRMRLCNGLEEATAHFKDVNCKTLYIDGSFSTKEPRPNDYDACWDPTGVDFARLMARYPVLMEFLVDTKRQKAKYGGEFYPSTTHLSFFQKDRDDSPKGIIQLNL